MNEEKEYRNLAAKFAQKEVKKFYNKIPGGENYGKNGYEIHHIYTVDDGLKDNVDISIISSWVNLAIIGKKLNESIGSKSSITLFNLADAYAHQRHV